MFCNDVLSLIDPSFLQSFHLFWLFCVRYGIDVTTMKLRIDNKLNWISGKSAKSRELVYKLIDINKEIDSNGKTFRVGDKIYFVRELG